MRLAAVDRMSPPMPDFSGSTIRIEQLPARRSVGVLLAFLVAVAAVLLFPFYLLASSALADQGLRAVVATRPLAAVQVLTGLAFWLFLVGFPITRLVDTLTRSRSVEIAGGLVTVSDRAFGRFATWQAPLSEFCGVVPYLRASLSGVRHELILLHPDRDRSVLIALADRLHQSDVDRIAGALAQPELPPRALHGRNGGRAPSPTLARTETPVAPATPYRRPVPDGEVRGVRSI